MNFEKIIVDLLGDRYIGKQKNAYMVIKTESEEPPANKKTKKVVEFILSAIMSVAALSFLILMAKWTLQ